MEATITGTVELQLPKSETPKAVTPTLKESITAVSQGMKSLLKSGLNRDAVIALLYDRMRPIKSGFRSPHKMTKKEILAVINAMSELEKAYVQ